MTPIRPCNCKTPHHANLAIHPPNPSFLSRTRTRTGCEQLITQLLGFGIEKHDDAVDALVYLILGPVGDGIEEQKVHYV
jgi:hypothetical protein